MNYYQITIPTNDTNKQELLIAALAELGFEGFEQSDTHLKAFVAEDEMIPASIDTLAIEYAFTWSKELIPKQNWNEVWESNFEPVQVEDFVGIRAGFHPPFTGVEHEIVITPKMSFGTGHHATTYMVMKLMRDIDFHGKTVYDFGTGTGILAILAEKLGAKDVLATDNDDWCIENAAENIAINECSNIKIKKIDILIFDKKYDIILANINRNIILENIAILKSGLAEGGQLLLSGLLVEDEKDIHGACQRIGLQQLMKEEKAGWIALRYF